MLKSFFTDKGNFSKKAYKDYFNFNAKRLNSKFEIKSLRYDKSTKTLFVDIIKKLEPNKCSELCFPTGIEGKILFQCIDLSVNKFSMTYTASIKDLNNEQKTLEFFNRTNFNQKSN